MDHFTYDSLCRICLEKQETLFSLFRNHKGCSPFEKLVSNTKLKIKINDGGPTSICSQCLKDLDTTVTFLGKCERSNEILALRCESISVDQKTHHLSVTNNNKIDLAEQKFESCRDDVQYDCKSLESAEFEVSKSEDVSMLLELEPHCPECGSRRRCRHWSPPSTFTCPYCQKVFNRKFNFTLHIKRHRDDRSWACSTCGARQVSRWLARRHCAPRMRRACPQPGCNKTFTTTTNLNTHIRKHNGERPFECDKCGKKFICKNTLNDHLKIHTGEKPYMCSVCGRQFATNKLSAHLATHAGAAARTHACPAPGCQKRFLSRRALSLHSAVHVSGGARRAHCCGLCPARYNHKQSLNKHLRKQHKQETQSADHTSQSGNVA